MATGDIKTFFDECQIETSEDVQSAAKAFRYLAGDIRRDFEALLDCDKQGIKKWEERGVQPLIDASLQEITVRRANTYQDDPNREILDESGEINEQKTADYAELLETSQFNQYVNGFDEGRSLGGAALVLVQFVDETNEILPTILTRNNCDVKWNAKTRKIDELIYTAGCGPNGGRLFHIWTDTHIKDIEKCGEGKSDVVTVTTHPYGVIPVAYAWDIAPPQCGFWPKARWEQLTYANDAISMFHTQTKFAQRYQAFPSLWSNASIPDGTLVGPDTVIDELSSGAPDIPVFIEYRSATDVDKSLAVFASWLESYKKSVAMQWGVNLRVDGNAGADSGFKLVVEEFPSLELRNKRIKSAIPFERQLHNAYTIVSSVHALDDISGRLRVDFREPRLPVNDKEQFEIAMGKVNLGVWTKEDFWRYENPDITPEEILERNTRIEAERVAATVARAPVFGDVNGS